MGAVGAVETRGVVEATGAVEWAGAVGSPNVTDAGKWTTAARLARKTRETQETRVWVVRDRDEERPETPVAMPPSPGWPDMLDGTPGSASASAEDEDDLRELRMERVAVLYGEITAATRAFLAAVAACDRHRDWEHAGFGSCAEWLAWRIGVTRNTANEKVRVALALEELPLTSEAMARGELSFSKVRALTRKATPATEPELLELARAGSAHNLERVLRSWTELDGVDEGDQARRERALHQSRRFSVFPDEQGMYVVRGRLTPEVAAVLMRAIEAASDALFQEATKGEGDTPDPAQLRADALGLVAERALAAGFQAPDAPVSGSRAERYQVMLHVEDRTLQQGGTGCCEEGGGNAARSNGRRKSAGRKNGLQPPLSELEDGTRVTAETARRLSCDAARILVRRTAGPTADGTADGSADRDGTLTRSVTASGTVTGAGRRTRTIPPATRRALEARDRGCRFPGCGLRFTDGHHIVHWADGGPTTLDNLVLLCRRHHRRVHEGRYQVCSGADGQIVFFTPAGRALYEAPPPPELPDRPVEALVQGNRDRGVVPDGWAAAPRWHRDRDIPWAIEAAALEALDPWDDEEDACEDGGRDADESDDRDTDEADACVAGAVDVEPAHPGPPRLPR